MTLNADVIVDSLPPDYRWAVEDETERWTDLAERMVQVRTGGTDDDPETDLAIRCTCTANETCDYCIDAGIFDD